jgi:hypothetical protein
MPSRPLSHSGPETGHKPLSAECDFHCDLETAVFLTVLYRLFDPGSASASPPIPPLSQRNRREQDPRARGHPCRSRGGAPPRGGERRVGNRLSPLPPTSGRRFEVNPRRIVLDALFDRIYVIRVSLKLTPRVLPRWLGGPRQRSRCSHPPQLSQYGETIRAASSPRSWL